MYIFLAVVLLGFIIFYVLFSLYKKSEQKKLDEYRQVGEEYKSLRDKQQNAYLKLLEQLQAINFELYEFVKNSFEQRDKILKNKTTSDEVKEKELKLLDKEVEIKENNIVKTLTLDEQNLFEKHMKEYQVILEETMPRLLELEEQMIKNMVEMKQDSENRAKFMNGLHGAHHAQMINRNMEEFWKDVDKK